MFVDRVLLLLMFFVLFMFFMLFVYMLPDLLEVLLVTDRVELALDVLLRLPGLSLFSLFLLAFLARRAANIIAETEKPPDFVDRCSGFVLLAGRGDSVEDLFLSGNFDAVVFVIGFEMYGCTSSDFF